MTEQEQLRLQWDNFETNFKEALQEMREGQHYFDVTLACEDKQIEAHRLILSASSPFFKSILSRNPQQHSILYLKGVAYSHLVSLLDFMYRGHVDVAQETLQEFLNVADDLKVQGLSDECEKGETRSPIIPNSPTPESSSQVQDNGPSAKRKHAPKDDYIGHSQAKYIKNAYNCSDCNRSFTRKQHLESHRSTIHRTMCTNLQNKDVHDVGGGEQDKVGVIKTEPPAELDQHFHMEENISTEDPLVSSIQCYELEDNGFQGSMEYDYHLDGEASYEEYKGATIRHPRTAMNIEDKIQIIEQLISVPKKSQMEIARAFGISQKQVSRISQRKEKILREYEAGYYHVKKIRDVEESILH